MIEDLKNKVVLITGASTGIGAGAAKAFGANGAKVAIHYNKSCDHHAVSRALLHAADARRI